MGGEREVSQPPGSKSTGVALLQSHDVNGHDFVWRPSKLYVTDLRDGNGRAVNGGDVHTFYVTDHLRDGLRNHSRSKWRANV